jgi:D-alanine--poly(phosphoribitol) ligase subunit 2
MKEKVIGIIAQATKMTPENINCDHHLVEQGIDSLDMFDILFTIQDEFNIKISEQSIANNEWTTVNKIIAKLEEMIPESV